jgi:eukaryotic-like serine/threonine-protein kinase
MAPGGCPTRETLAALAAGRLSGDALAAVAAHLDSCPSCLARAQAARQDTDPLVAAFCRPGLLDTYVQEAGYEQAVARVRALAAGGADAETATVLALGPGAVQGGPGGSAPAGGRYRPVRFHARGGLGEVHIALDEELSRQVALKRIWGPRATDPESRRRFLHEAAVTARLEHPGVVPVYGLVQDSSGQPCYAMRFIQGETLEDALTRFHAQDGTGRDPGERRLALRELLGRFVAVCNTIAYAHSKGVLHRDLKPANIMLGAYGETLVVDWGLAKPFGDGRSEPTAGADAPPTVPGSEHTKTGQALGTPAYMSPEQAKGQAKAVGPATDVYGLGATLYAVLTGRPPLEGPTAEVLEQVRQGKVPPPRAWKQDVPRPLEAICQKAMARRPEDRYDTALALAADIEHWLADEPVSVYRGTLGERWGRWARRHRTVVIAATAVGLATLLGVSLLAWQSEQSRQRLAREQAATEEARQQAEANARRERQAIRDYFVRASDDPAWKAVGLEPLRRKLLEEARTYLLDFVQSQGEGPELLAELAEAHARLGNITAELGDRQLAQREFEAALALDERLAAAQPGELKFRNRQASSWKALGRLWKSLEQGRSALQGLDRAADLAEGLVVEQPAEPEYLQTLSSILTNRAEVQKDLGNVTAARQDHERGLALDERLVKEHPREPQYQHDLAVACNDLGVLLRSRFGELPGARRAYERAAEVLEQLVKDHPLVPGYQWDLGMTHNNLAVLYEHLGDLPRARKAHARSLELHHRLHAEHPAVPEYRRDLAMNHNNLGELLLDQRDLAGARREIEQAVALREPLAQLYPAVPEYRQDLARGYKSLGMVLMELNELPAAEQALEKALALRQHPKVPEYCYLLANTYNSLGMVRHQRGNRAGCRQAKEMGIALSAQLVAEQPGVLSYAVILAQGCANLANLEREEGRLAAAVELSSRAIAALGGDFRGKLDVFARRVLSAAHRSRARALARLERHAEAVKDFDDALALDDGANRQELHLERGLSLAQLGEHARAVLDAEKGVPSDKPTAEALYDAAHIYALSAAKLQQDVPGNASVPLSRAQRNELAQKYTDRAMALLTQAVRKGYKNAKCLRTEKALEPLRTRDDFQKLLKELDAAPERP